MVFSSSLGSFQCLLALLPPFPSTSSFSLLPIILIWLISLTPAAGGRLTQVLASSNMKYYPAVDIPTWARTPCASVEFKLWVRRLEGRPELGSNKIKIIKGNYSLCGYSKSELQLHYVSTMDI